MLQNSRPQLSSNKRIVWVAGKERLICRTEAFVINDWDST